MELMDRRGKLAQRVVVVGGSNEFLVLFIDGGDKSRVRVAG